MQIHVETPDHARPKPDLVRDIHGNYNRRCEIGLEEVDGYFPSRHVSVADGSKAGPELGHENKGVEFAGVDCGGEGGESGMAEMEESLQVLLLSFLFFLYAWRFWNGKWCFGYRYWIMYRSFPFLVDIFGTALSHTL